MGIFSDRCDALIDPETGKALGGAALKEARRERKWLRCRNRVSKAARFCNACGKKAPGGWWKCPACGKWIGNDSNFCAHCSTALNPESRIDLAGGVWQKGMDVLAQRFDAGEVKRLLKNGLQIQAGTVAVLLDAGKVSDVIGPGRYEPETLARKINWFGNPPPRTVVLVDEGDIALPLRIEGLRSSEQMELEFYGEVVLRFNSKRSEQFVSNLLKHRQLMQYAELTDILSGEIRHAVDAMCVSSTIHDLVRDPQRRLRLEDMMEGMLKGALESYGFDLVRVSQCEFTGDAYEELAGKEGDVEQTRRRIELDHRLSELLSAEKMGQFKTQADLEEYLEQLAQERAVSGFKRGREIEIMQAAWQQQDQLAEMRHQMVMERDGNSHKIQQAVQWDDYNREKTVADAEAAAKARARAFEQEAVETEHAVKWREQKTRIKQQDFTERAKAVSGRTIEEMIAVVEDPQQREQLLKLHQQQVSAGISEKEVLANARLEMLQDQKKMTEESAARLERVIKEALQAMGKAAQKESTQQIIK